MYFRSNFDNAYPSKLAIFRVSGNAKIAKMDFLHNSSTIGPVKQKKNKHKIAIVFLCIRLNISFGAQKNRLIEMVLLSTHNIFFG